MSSALRVTDFQPRAGWPGTIVTISGANFSPLLDGNTIQVGGDQALVLKADVSKLQVLVGEKAVAGPVIVTRGGVSATLPSRLFTILPWPDVTNLSNNGIPKTFHGPQPGTPKVGKLNQKILVAFCHDRGSRPANADDLARRDLEEMADANRYWSQVTYADQRASDPSGIQGTTWDFRLAPGSTNGWVELPKKSQDYVWGSGDLDGAWDELFKQTARWSVILHDGSNRAVCAHKGGGIVTTDLNFPPTEVAWHEARWTAYHIAVQNNNLVFVAAGIDGLRAVDISGSVPTDVRLPDDPRGSHVFGCDIVGNILVTTAVNGPTTLYDISDRNAISMLAEIGETSDDDGANCRSVKAIGNYVLLGHKEKVLLFNITDPARPIREDFYLSSTDDGRRSRVSGIDVVGNICVVSTIGAGVAILEMVDNGRGGVGLEERAKLRQELDVRSVQIAADGNKAIAALGPKGIMVLDVSNPMRPNVLATAPVPDSSSASRSGCFHVAHATLERGVEKCIASFGSFAVAAVGNALSSSPRVSAPGILSHSASSGGNANFAQLRDAISNAANEFLKLKHDGDFFIDVIHKLWELDGGLKLVPTKNGMNLPPQFNIPGYAGFLFLLHGVAVRASAPLVDEAIHPNTSESIKFGSMKGAMWAATGTGWKTFAHELGHWLSLDDMYEEVYADDSVVAGTASDWDMMGRSSEAALFCGAQADALKIYREGNIISHTWSPTDTARTEHHVLVAHGASEDGVEDLEAHMLKIIIPGTDTIYYAEVREWNSPRGPLVFDNHVPIFGTTPDGPKARVLVTRAQGTASSISNTRERKTQLWGVLNEDEAVVDARRRIKITALELLGTEPARFRVRLEMNVAPAEGNELNLFMAPMIPGDWESPDIWVNSIKNDDSGITYDADPDTQGRPMKNGDEPWVKHRNTIFARVHNEGPGAAEDVYVTAYVNSPPGIGDNGNWASLATQRIGPIGQNSWQEAEFDWVPEKDQHTCLRIAVYRQDGEPAPTPSNDDNVAQENVFKFDSPGASSHEPVVFQASVRNPFTIWRRVDLRVFGLPDGWHATVSKKWVWLPPRGETPLTIVIWTDKDSPRLSDEEKDKRIEPRAFVRVEGWASMTEHAYKPIGGLLAAVRANARSSVALTASASDNQLQTSIQLTPGEAGVPGVLEITMLNLAQKPKLIHFTTGAGGTARVTQRLENGQYEIQAFTSSTDEVAEAESSKVPVRVS